MKKRNIAIIIVAILLLAVAIGYAALSQALTINGTANINSNWDVKITGITKGTFTSASETGGVAATFTGTTATFEVDLDKPGASATYAITVENAGTINAKLDEVTDLTSVNSAAPTEVTYSIDATKGDALAANGGTKTYNVKVEWDKDSTSIPTTKTKTATITLKYVQAD